MLLILFILFDFIIILNTFFNKFFIFLFFMTNYLYIFIFYFIKKRNIKKLIKDHKKKITLFDFLKHLNNILLYNKLI